MRACSKALKVADLKDALTKAGAAFAPKANKAELVTKVLASPEALAALGLAGSTAAPAAVEENDDLVRAFEPSSLKTLTLFSLLSCSWRRLQSKSHARDILFSVCSNQPLLVFRFDWDGGEDKSSAPAAAPAPAPTPAVAAAPKAAPAPAVSATVRLLLYARPESCSRNQACCYTCPADSSGLFECRRRA